MIIPILITKPFDHFAVLNMSIGLERAFDKKRSEYADPLIEFFFDVCIDWKLVGVLFFRVVVTIGIFGKFGKEFDTLDSCLLYTSDAADE